jgi:hypothetical protein
VTVRLALATAFRLVQHTAPSFLPAWVTALLLLVLLAAAVLAALRRRLDVLGLAVGALLTYVWVGMTNAVDAGRAGVVEQLVIIAIALALAVLALRRRRAAIAPSRPAAAAAGRATTRR